MKPQFHSRFVHCKVPILTRFSSSRTFNGVEIVHVKAQERQSQATDALRCSYFECANWTRNVQTTRRTQRLSCHLWFPGRSVKSLRPGGRRLAQRALAGRRHKHVRLRRMSSQRQMEDCGSPAPLEIFLVALMVLLFVFLTAVNLGNNLTTRPPLDELLIPQEVAEEGSAVVTGAPATSIQTGATADLRYREFYDAPGYPGIDGDVIELDDLVTDAAESSASSPPPPSNTRAERSRPRTRSNPLRNRTPLISRPRSRESEEAASAGPATSQEPHQDQLSFYTLLRRRRPNDTESRGSEVYRLEPYDPYYRRRAASVPTLGTDAEDT